MKLYLDDKRNPPDNTWILVRTFQAAVDFVLTQGVPAEISFDHDLGIESFVRNEGVMVERSGYDFAKWLVEKDLDGEINLTKDFKFNVHSANPVGARNIRELLTKYLENKHVAVQQEEGITAG